LKKNPINKYKIFNDPIYGFISIPFEIIFDLIEHPYFQRLRRISQTGLTNYVYPGATHTRFHHALGSMHLMYHTLQILKNKQIEISEEEEKAALIAILLHDIGHGPFSHALENTLMDEIHHEKISLILIEKLNEEFNGKLSLAIEMFLGKYPRKFFKQLISSQLDVDRLDYLKRDSFYTGVSEGNINSERILTMLNVFNDELVVDSKGIYSIEKYLTSRMFMYWQVYFHKTSFAAETYLIQTLKRAKDLINNNIEVVTNENLFYFLKKNSTAELTDKDISIFTTLDDSDVLSAIKSWQNHSDKILSILAKSIINRNLPKAKIVLNSLSDVELMELKEKTAKKLHISNPEYFVHQNKIQVIPYQNDKDPIMLLYKNNRCIPLQEAENQMLTKSLSQISERYFICYPRFLKH